MRLRRVLAAARPDAFTPDLAMSLSVLGDALEAGGRVAEAVPHDEEAVRLVGPYFLSRPGVFVGPMVTYVRDYVRRCEAAGQEPDWGLLGPIVEKLTEVEKGGSLS